MSVLGIRHKCPGQPSPYREFRRSSHSSTGIPCTLVDVFAEYTATSSPTATAFAYEIQFTVRAKLARRLSP